MFKTESFVTLFTGKLRGILKEDKYIELAESLSGSWFAITFENGGSKIEVIDEEGVKTRMLSMLDEVRSKNLLNSTFPYTYVHTPDDPQMVKMYDPIKCGSGCGPYGAPPPWLVLSKVEPTMEELEALAPKDEKKENGFFKKMIGR